MLVTLKEIEEITKRRRRKAQIKVLIALGIPHQIRPDGSILIYRDHLPNASAQSKQASPSVRLPTSRRVLPRPARQVDAAR